MKTFKLLFSKSETISIAKVSLDTWTTEGKDGAPLLTEQCVNYRELEDAIGRLKRELDAILAEGRQKFLKDTAPTS